MHPASLKPAVCCPPDPCLPAEAFINFRGQYLRDLALTKVTGTAARGSKLITVRGGGRAVLGSVVCSCILHAKEGCLAAGVSWAGSRAHVEQPPLSTMHRGRPSPAASLLPMQPQVANSSQLRVGQYVVLVLSDKGGTLNRYL